MSGSRHRRGRKKRPKARGGGFYFETPEALREHRELELLRAKTPRRFKQRARKLDRPGRFER